MKKGNRLVAGVLAILMMVSSLFCGSVYAEGEIHGQTEYATQYAAYSQNQKFEALVDLDSFKKKLSDALGDFESSIDISAYGIPATEENIDAIGNLIFNEMPEMFHVSSFRYYYYTGSMKMTRLAPNYRFSSELYQTMLGEIEGAKESILDGIIGNSCLSDREKALLIHDRIALNCEYDYNEGQYRYDIYGVFVKKTAVCAGYAEAYSYLLDAVGIDNYVCVSKALNHAWNVIKIEDEWYHVDVTWDDYAWEEGMRGVVGAVGHKYFMLSTELFLQSHRATDFDTRPDDPSYDFHFWQNSNSAFYLIEDEIYYIDNLTGSLCRYRDGEKLCDVVDEWSLNGVKWSNNARLTTDGTDLYYSLADAVYKYDIEKGESAVFFEPSLHPNYSIYGLSFEDGYLICDINDSPPYSAYQKTGLYQLRAVTAALGDITPPTAEILSTNHVAESQSVSLIFSDDGGLAGDGGIAGYYWGTKSNGISNPYTVTNSFTAAQTVSSEGTYYLVVEDTNGNRSEPCSITFYKTVLDGNGAAVAPEYVLTPSGQSFDFPSPKKEGYAFKGWAQSASATTGQASLTPTQNATYYAIFEELPLSGVRIMNEPSKTSYYIGDALDLTGLKLELTYSDGFKKQIESGFSVIGFSSAAAGTFEVMVAYKNKADFFSVSVKSPELLLSVSAKALELQEHYTLIATPLPENQPISWTSSDPAVATVEDGRVVAIGCGTTNITASFTYNSIVYSRECIVRVGESALSGDANDDGMVDTADVILVLRYLMEGALLEEAPADFNGDGEVRISDAVMILRQLSGQLS